MGKLFVWIAILLPALSIAEPLRVFVSVLPQKTFVEKIGAQHVEARAIVRPGYNPRTYDPAPQQIAALAKGVLYVRIGVPFEHNWMERIRFANREMQVLDVPEGMDSCATEEHEHGSENELGGEHDSRGDSSRPVAEAGPDLQASGAPPGDPHLWTNPALVKIMARSIRDKLTELDPEHGEDYARNYDAFAAELDALDRELGGLLENLPNRRFMVFHPAWGCFADAYGLIQVPVENEGKEPGPRALAALIEQAKREQVKVIFVQPQFSRKSAEQVARSIGGRVVAIDPLSSDYADNLRDVAREIAEAARE